MPARNPMHELRKAPPDLRRLSPSERLSRLPEGGRDDRQHEGPHADPDVAPDDFHQGEGIDRGIRVAGDAGHLAGIAAVGLRRGKSRGIGQFRGADPGAGDAGRQAQAARRPAAARRSARWPRTPPVKSRWRYAPSWHPPQPVMAMEADTPHTAPPVPSTAARRRSSPRRVADEIDHAECHQRHDRRLQQRHRARPGDQGQRQAGSEQHDAGLDIELHPQARGGPALRQAHGIGDQQAQHQPDQRRLQAVARGLVPLAEEIQHQRDQDRQRRRYRGTRRVR